MNCVKYLIPWIFSMSFLSIGLIIFPEYRFHILITWCIFTLIISNSNTTDWIEDNVRRKKWKLVL